MRSRPTAEEIRVACEIVERYARPIQDSFALHFVDGSVEVQTFDPEELHQAPSLYEALGLARKARGVGVRAASANQACRGARRGLV